MKNKDYNLSEKRKEIIVWVKKNFPYSISDGCLDYIFGEVGNQDKEFIKRLKAPIKAELKEANKHKGSIAQTVALLFQSYLKIIDKLAGEELTSPKGDKGVEDG